MPRPRAPPMGEDAPDACLPDDRGSGGRHLGRLGADRAAHGAARPGGALPLRPLHRDHPGAGRRARRLGDARRSLRGHATGSGSARWSHRPPSGTRASSRGWPSTVDHISQGRVEVGMGSGWYEREHLEHGFPFLDAQAALRALRGAGGGRRPLLDRGRVRPRRPCVPAARSDGAAAPAPGPHPPLVLGGTVKPRFAALAARYADEVNTLGAPNDESGSGGSASTARARRRGATRRPSPLSVMTSCFLGSDRAEAVSRVGAFLEVRGRRRRGGAARPAGGPLACGTVEEVAARIEELRAIGVEPRVAPAPEPLGRRRWCA